MAIELTAGKKGARIRNYRVYVSSMAIINARTIGATPKTTADRNISFINDIKFGVKNKKFNQAYTVDYLFELLSDRYNNFQNLGEIEIGSLNIDLGNGTMIEGNESGELTLEKTLECSFRMINVTKDNHDNILEWLDDKKGMFVFEEINGRVSDEFFTTDGGVDTYSQDTHEIIFFGFESMPEIQITEKAVGKDIYSMTFRLKTSVPKAVSNDKIIIDLPFDLLDQPD